MTASLTPEQIMTALEYPYRDRSDAAEIAATPDSPDLVAYLAGNPNPWPGADDYDGYGRQPETDWRPPGTYFGHTHHEGPACPVSEYDEAPGCAHSSCAELQHELCYPCEELAQAEAAAGVVYCQQHGRQNIARTAQFTGYAGGLCFYAVLTCGCTDLDESADLRAAR